MVEEHNIAKLENQRFWNKFLTNGVAPSPTSMTFLDVSSMAIWPVRRVGLPPDGKIWCQPGSASVRQRLLESVCW